MKALALLPLLLLAACEQKVATLEGRPCPVLPAAEFERRAIVLKNTSELGGATVRRQFGNLNCDGGSTLSCELSSPGVLHVRVKGRDSYFQLPVGTPAALQVKGEQVTCVRRD